MSRIPKTARAKTSWSHWTSGRAEIREAIRLPRTIWTLLFSTSSMTPLRPGWPLSTTARIPNFWPPCSSTSIKGYGVTNTIGNQRIAAGPLQELDLSQFRPRQHFFRPWSSPPASKVVTVSCSSLCAKQTTHSIDCMRPSMQFVNRFDGEDVRRLQSACDPNFPSEECLHAGSIG
jgi:hypothetical protein